MCSGRDTSAYLCRNRSGSIPFLDKARLDPRTVVFAILLSLLCGALFWNVPALQRPRAGALAARSANSGGTRGFAAKPGGNADCGQHGFTLRRDAASAKLSELAGTAFRNDDSRCTYRSRVIDARTVR